MKIGNIAAASIAGVVLILASLLFNYSYVWSTYNSQGPISYDMRAYGLPLQYIYQEVSSPVGPSSFFKVSPTAFVVDFLVWAAFSYLIIFLVRRRTRSRGPPADTASVS